MLSFDITQYELLKAMLDKSSIIIAHLLYISFQAFWMVVFTQWGVFFFFFTPCSKGLFQCFRETYCPYHQGDQICFTEGAQVSGMKEHGGYISRLNRTLPLKAATDGTVQEGTWFVPSKWNLRIS